MTRPLCSCVAQHWSFVGQLAGLLQESAPPAPVHEPLAPQLSVQVPAMQQSWVVTSHEVDPQAIRPGCAVGVSADASPALGARLEHASKTTEPSEMRKRMITTLLSAVLRRLVNSRRKTETWWRR